MQSETQWHRGYGTALADKRLDNSTNTIILRDCNLGLFWSRIVYQKSSENDQICPGGNTRRPIYSTLDDNFCTPTNNVNREPSSLLIRCRDTWSVCLNDVTAAAADTATTQRDPESEDDLSSASSWHRRRQFVRDKLLSVNHHALINIGFCGARSRGRVHDIACAQIDVWLRLQRRRQHACSKAGSFSRPGGR